MNLILITQCEISLDIYTKRTNKSFTVSLGMTYIILHKSEHMKWYANNTHTPWHSYAYFKHFAYNLNDVTLCARHFETMKMMLHKIRNERSLHFTCLKYNSTEYRKCVYHTMHGMDIRRDSECYEVIFQRWALRNSEWTKWINPYQSLSAVCIM